MTGSVVAPGRPFASTARPDRVGDAGNQGTPAPLREKP